MSRRCESTSVRDGCGRFEGRTGLTTWTLRTLRPTPDHGGVGLLRRSSRRRRWSGRGLLSKASFQKPERGGIASLHSLMSSTCIPNETVASSAWRRCIAFAGLGSRLVRSLRSWASRRGTPAASSPRACSWPFAGSWCVETRRSHRLTLRRHDRRCRTCLGGAGDGHPAAPFDLRSRSLSKVSTLRTRRLEACSDQPIGRCRKPISGRIFGANASSLVRLTTQLACAT